jgi:hypothetical protein
MSGNFRQNILSDYERQLTTADVPEPGWLFLGSNVKEAWELTGSTPYDVVHFLAEYEQPLLPTVAVTTGAKGESLVAELPATCKKSFLVKVKDYDEELLDQFKEWHAGRVELRLYSYADWFAECYLVGIPLVRPRGDELLLTFAPHTVWVFKASTPARFICDYANGHPTFNIGILTHVYKYGGI